MSFSAEECEKLALRLWRRLDTSQHSPGGCWEWMGGGRGGYGRLTVRRQGLPREGIDCHVLAYRLANGSIPAGLDVRHRCHNKRCCNPSHLLVGTRQQNMDDSVRDGRICCGEARPEAKLTVADVLFIRQSILLGVKQRILARQFGVTQSAISMANRGRNWSSVPAPTAESRAA